MFNWQVIFDNDNRTRLPQRVGELQIEEKLPNVFTAIIRIREADSILGRRAHSELAVSVGSLIEVAPAK
jgi:hypothetical protein